MEDCHAAAKKKKSGFEDSKITSEKAILRFSKDLKSARLSAEVLVDVD